MVLVWRVFGDNFQVYGRAQGLAAIAAGEQGTRRDAQLARLMRAVGLQM